MITAWTEHLKTQEEKVQFEQSIKHSRWILEHLSTMIDKLDAGVERSELNPKVYESNSWAYRQADTNGYRRALRNIKQLLDLKE